MKEKVLDNCSYNCVKQLSKQLELLWNLDGYIKDAKDCGHGDCKKVFEIIRKDSRKHAEMLKGIIAEKAKGGGFD